MYLYYYLQFQSFIYILLLRSILFLMTHVVFDVILHVLHLSVHVQFFQLANCYYEF